MTTMDHEQVRLTALDQAVRLFVSAPNTTYSPSDVLKYAKAFEEFLAGRAGR